MTKQDAAKTLKLSVQRIAGYVRERKVGSTKAKNPQTNQLVTLIVQTDVERILQESEKPSKVVKVAAAVSNKPKPADNIARYSMARPCPMLTLDEASKVLRIGKDRLLAIAKSGEYPKSFRDLGERAKGGRYRVLLEPRPVDALC